MRGTNSAAVQFRALAAIDMISIDSTNAFGNRYGILEGIYCNGNGLANRGFNLGLAIERTFIGCRAENCKAGWVLRNTQNCMFISCEMENNTVDATNGAGIRISWGAANNVFLRCEINQNNPYQIRFHALQTLDPVTSPAPANNYPLSNIFLGCVIERHQPTAIAMIDMRAGRSNQFRACTIGMSPTPAITMFQCNNTDDQVNLTTFDGVHITGLAGSTIFQLQNHVKLRLKAVTCETALTFVTSDDNSTVMMDGDCHLAAITNVFTNFAGGVKARDAVMYTDFLDAILMERALTVQAPIHATAGGIPTTSLLGANVTSAVVTGNNTRGTIAFTVTAPVAGTRLCLVSFSTPSPYANKPTVILTNAAGNALPGVVFATAGESAAQFEVWIGSALGTGTYNMNYEVVGAG